MEPEAERNYQQRIYDDKKRTCRKAWYFVCSAYEECGNDVLIIAEDLRKAERLVRDARWSVLKDLGWTCPACRKLYRHPKGNVGPRVKLRKYRTAVTNAEARHKRLTIQELWQIRLQAEEPRGNDLGEMRQ